MRVMLTIKKRNKIAVRCDYCDNKIKVGETYIELSSDNWSRRKLFLHLACGKRVAKQVIQKIDEEIKREIRRRARKLR